MTSALDPHLFHDRREILVALLGLPLAASACRSGGSRPEDLRDAQETTRERLVEVATGPEEAEHLLSIYTELQDVSTRFVTAHLDFVETADGRMKDRTATSAELEGLLEANVTDRAEFIRRLLDCQQRIKSDLGPERWARFVESMNDRDRMENAHGRGA